MNPNEIKKGLECCIKDDCDNCPNPFGNCEHNLMSDALAYINQLETNLTVMRMSANSYKMHYENAKAEAYKEFAERLKEAFPNNSHWIKPREKVDNLVKEMVGDTE